MKEQSAITQVQTYIQAHQLFSPSHHLLVALSGGADSVALLHLLLQMGYSCEAAHCNFHLRGQESMRDEAFVRHLCQHNQVTLHVKDFDTQAYAATHKVSIEMAARELRYAWFHEILADRHLDYIAVAHHRDDNVETILLNLLRGTGIDGLTGMKPLNGHIVRPLLSLTRNDILAYLESIGQPYVTDSTNLQPHYKRNRIRLQLLPLMRQLNPKAEEAIIQAATHLNQYATLAQHSIAQSLSRITDDQGHISISLLMQEPSPELILFQELHPKGFTRQQIQSILQGKDHQSLLFLSPTHQLLIDRGQLILAPISQPLATSQYSIPADGQYSFPGGTITCRHLSDLTIHRDPHTATLDAATLSFPLQLRTTRPGDRFRPFGMKGTKLVSDYLTDRKRTLFQKQNQWVITSADEIVWLIGETIAAPYAITPETQQVIRLQLEISSRTP